MYSIPRMCFNKTNTTNTHTMIQFLLTKLLKRRHFWRYATFSEVAELYASRVLRMMAINLSATFLAVYLYQNHYSLAFIALCWWGVYFFGKALLSIPIARLAARYGPKHGILMSNLMYIPAMLVFSTVPRYGLWAIVIGSLFQAWSATQYDLCHLINFSKVKNSDHAGKEIAYMNIFEKIAVGLSPVIGGALAFIAGPQVAMWVAAGLFALAALPLLRTGEQVTLHRTVSFRAIAWRPVWRSLAAEMAVGWDTLASGSLWSLFLAIVLLGTGNDIYAKLGGLASITVCVALVSSYIYGRLIDRRQGGFLLKVGVIADAVTHLARPFVSTPVGILMVNAANEAATTGYSMAFTRGMFDTADLSGNRIVYLLGIEIAVNLGFMIGALVLFGLVSTLGDVAGMRLFFVMSGLVALGISGARFHLYRRA